MGSIRDERRDFARTEEVTAGRLPLFEERCADISPRS